jgi:hypothetical protein
MNYSELVQAIQDYTQNEETSFVSNIPTFVQQAEERINRSIMLPELRKNVTASTLIGNKYIARPSDFSIGVLFCGYRRCWGYHISTW